MKKRVFETIKKQENWIVNLFLKKKLKQQQQQYTH